MQHARKTGQLNCRWSASHLEGIAKIADAERCDKTHVVRYAVDLLIKLHAHYGSLDRLGAHLLNQIFDEQMDREVRARLALRNQAETGEALIDQATPKRSRAK